MDTLTFPALVSDGNMKRPFHQAFHRRFPAKRRKTVLPEYDDDILMDSFCFFDIESFETSSLVSTESQGKTFSLSALLDLANEIVTDNDCSIDSQLEATGDSHQDQGQLARAISRPRQRPTAISSVLYTIQPAVHHVPPFEIPLQQLPSADSSTFSISNVKNTTEPTLLTLTSYPYRIIHCNEAFSRLCVRNAPVIGDSVFDAFDIEGMIMTPSLTIYPTLEGHLDNKVALFPSFTDKQSRQYWIRCEIQVNPVSKRDGSDTLRYFAVCFTPLQPPL